MDWIQKYKAVIDMNEKRITFRVDGRKFTTKLVPDEKPQNKIYYYTISESEDVIDLTITDDDITEAMDGDDESCPIMIDSGEESTSSEEETTLIPNQLKGQFLDDVIASSRNWPFSWLGIKVVSSSDEVLSSPESIIIGQLSSSPSMASVISSSVMVRSITSSDSLIV